MFVKIEARQRDPGSKIHIPSGGAGPMIRWIDLGKIKAVCYLDDGRMEVFFDGPCATMILDSFEAKQLADIMDKPSPFQPA